jgi:hypothetical protein
MPRKIMAFSRPMWVGTSADHDRRTLEGLMFGFMVSDAVKAAAGPLPRYVCDHQAYDAKCPRGCTDIPDFRLLPGRGDEELKFECTRCGTIVADPDIHARTHGLPKYAVDTLTAMRTRERGAEG